MKDSLIFGDNEYSSFSANYLTQSNIICSNDVFSNYHENYVAHIIVDMHIIKLAVSVVLAWNWQILEHERILIGHLIWSFWYMDVEI